MNDLNLHFTCNISKHAICFLDVEVYVSNNGLHMKLHHKSTAGNITLHSTSFHPRHTINSIPYSEMLRIGRICSGEKDLAEAQSASSNASWREATMKT